MCCPYCTKKHKKIIIIRHTHTTNLIRSVINQIRHFLTHREIRRETLHEDTESEDSKHEAQSPLESMRDDETNGQN